MIDGGSTATRKKFYHQLAYLVGLWYHGFVSNPESRTTSSDEKVETTEENADDA